MGLEATRESGGMKTCVGGTPANGGRWQRRKQMSKGSPVCVLMI